VPHKEVLSWRSTEVHGMPLSVPSPPALILDPSTIWYTDVSKKSSEGKELIGAGVSNESRGVALRIDAPGRGATNTITCPELVAILVTMRQIENLTTHETIATNSQASTFMIHRQLYVPHKLADCKHKEILQKIVEILLHRASQGAETTFVKVKSHIGILGNEAADKLAGDATDSSLCHQAVSVGNKGLKDMFWPMKTVQAARQDRPAVTWQVGNLNSDVKKTVSPLCQTGDANATIYSKAWNDLQPHTLSEPNNAFFNSTAVTFQEKKNTLKARYGTL